MYKKCIFFLTVNTTVPADDPLRLRKNLLMALSNKKFQSIIKEIFIRCRKLNISCFYHKILFFCSERSLIKFHTLL